MRGEGLVDGGDVKAARDVPAVRKNAPRFRLLAARCLAATPRVGRVPRGAGRRRRELRELRGGRGRVFLQRRRRTNQENLQRVRHRAAPRAAHEALENRPLARRWYIAALAADPFCYAALEALVANHALSAEEERALIDSLAFDPEDEWLRFLYTSMGKKYDEPAIESGLEMLEEIAGFTSAADEPSGAIAAANSTSDETRARRERLAELPAELLALRDNGDVALARAEWYYHRGDFQKCHDTCLVILERDPFQLKALPVYLATATELRRKNELYLRAHELVEEYPTRAVSWFAVGCYYYCVRRFDAARRYFSKATSLDGAFVPAWIGFGHAFAAQDESDQAMAAYRTAARLFPGCHLPALCIGMEYRRANNLSLAEQFFVKSRGICPGDPLVHNELGVLAYRNKEYGRAVTHLRDAVALAPRPLTDEWEASVVNVAHAYRKMNDFDAAIEWYERALSLAPRCAGTHTALGFTHQLKGNFQTNMSEAIECYHRALSLRPDDAFAQEMLTLALIDQCAVTMPPYNFVSYEPLGAPYADEPGGRRTRGRTYPWRRRTTRRTTTWRCPRGRETDVAAKRREVRSRRRCSTDDSS